MHYLVRPVKKIIHIVYDEKFIDMAYREFEAVFPEVNKFIILGKQQSLRYINDTPVDFLTLPKAIKLIRSAECSAVIFHSLNSGWMLLDDIPIGKKVIWLGWGYDYYQRLLSDANPEGIILPNTRLLLEKNPRRSFTTRVISACKRTFELHLGYSVPYRQEMLKRIDAFSPVLDIEYDMARKFNPWFKPEYIPWNYGTVEEDLSSNKNLRELLGDNILVGNSATAENNHVEIFDILEQRVDLRGRSIIVPLSYGSPVYREKILSIGRNKFGKQFLPLIDFLHKDDFVSLLQTCGYVFMNHLRQQALGNICITLLNGAKIYMNQASPLYRWLEQKGVVLHSIDTISKRESTLKQTLEPLTDTEQKSNKDVIKKHWGRQVQRERTLRLVHYALDIDRWRKN